jgi:hypothetical protein
MPVRSSLGLISRRRGSPFDGFGYGFSLIEVLIVAALSAVVIMAAATVAVSETKASIKSYVIQSLRDKYARLTYFLEVEIGEGGQLSIVRDTATCPAVATPAAPTGVTSAVQYLFTVRHRYTRAQGLGSAYSCFFNVPLVNNPGSDPNHWALYRYGPAIGDRSGVIGLTAADSAIPVALNPGLYVVSPYAFVYNVSLNRQAACGTDGLANVDDVIKYSCDGRTLAYSLRVGSGSLNRSSLWNATYPPSNTDVLVYARARVL